MKVGIIGSVGSSLLTLKKLIEYHFDIAGVWGYEPASILNVSGYQSMRQLAEDNHLLYYPFVKVNALDIKKQIRDANLDICFVVGLSQLIDNDIIKSPRYGCVGFHPTKLPHGRGRAPIAWLVMNEKEGAATFFKIDETADAGDIYIQEAFAVTGEDDACSVMRKAEEAMSIALDKWLPLLLEGRVVGIQQDNKKATYYAKRAPNDGCINWFDKGAYIDRLIKASTDPHPGAFSFYGNFRVLIWKSCYHSTGFPHGVVGRVVALSDFNPVLQTGHGFVELINYQIVDYSDNRTDKKLTIGSRLGYYDQYEIFKLRNEIELIKEKINQSSTSSK